MKDINIKPEEIKAASSAFRRGFLAAVKAAPNAKENLDKLVKKAAQFKEETENRCLAELGLRAVLAQS